MEQKIKINTREKTFLGDKITPIGVYLTLRDRFCNTFLLESSDYNGQENSFSYICCLPIAHFKATHEQVETKFPNEQIETSPTTNLKDQLSSFVSSFDAKNVSDGFSKTGLFGYMSYDSVSHFEKVKGIKTLDNRPLAQYHLFQFLIVINHFNNQCYLIESFVDESNDSLFDEVFFSLQQNDYTSFPFSADEHITSNMSDEDYLSAVEKGIEHCQKGDLFQVVFSRKFFASYTGDDFQVYRALKSINPSPYLFYFDYVDFRLFGSSPEAQLVINGDQATIHPIAGTFRRTGNDTADRALAQQLFDDVKENSEHIMLVDLARNDLSRCCDEVKVAVFKELQFFSHVIHMTSKVTGTIQPGHSMIDIVSKTLPAGTLSGAPKIKAMEIIAATEKDPRGTYGGAVGFLDFNNNFNHAITIRSFVSYNNTLEFQAGAGIVAKSKPESELQEIFNKTKALKEALIMATHL